MVMTNRTYAIGIDVGGTKTRFGIVSTDEWHLFNCLPEKLSIQSKILGEVKLLRRHNMLACSTPTLLLYPDKTVAQLQQSLVELICEVVNQLLVECSKNAQVKQVGISFAGLVTDDGVIVKAADLYFDWGQWKEVGIEQNSIATYRPFELQRILSEKIPDLQWQVMNDVTAAACRYITSDEYKPRFKSALLTISTGIGYVLLPRTRFYLETAKVVSLGHHVIDASSNARTCDCGGVGHLTAYASGKAVTKRIREYALSRLAEFQDSRLRQIALQRVEASVQNSSDRALIAHLSANDVAVAINQGDCFVQPLFEDVIAALSQGLVEIINSGVESIIIMGGFAQAIGPRLILALTETLKKQYSWITPSFFNLGYADDADGVLGVCKGMQIHANNHQGGVQRGCDEFGNQTISLHALTHHTTRVWNHFSLHEQDRDFYYCLSSYGMNTSKALFVVDTRIAHTYNKLIRRYCRQHGVLCEIFEASISTSVNSTQQLTKLLAKAQKFGLGRTDVFVSVGDILTCRFGGMAAGLFRRGIAHISIIQDVDFIERFVTMPMTLKFRGFDVPIGTPFHPPGDVYIVSSKSFKSTSKTQNKHSYQHEIDSFSVSQTQHLWQLDNPTFRIQVKKRPITIVISYAAEKLYGGAIRAYIKQHDITTKWLHFSAGEEGKYWSTGLKLARQITRHCKNNGAELLVAIGGGVTMDLTGFAASLIGRPYLRIPTTLLGAIDASVGVKVGVNFNSAKNFLGDFYSPESTVIDTEMLRTVSARNIRAGLAEIIKMGVIIAPKIIDLLEQHARLLVAERFQKDTQYAGEVIDLSIYWMMSELQRNLHEDHSLQRLVDFGHAFSPVIELRSHHQIIHGEAVAIDMAICMEMAFRMHLCTQETRDRILNMLIQIGLMVWHPVCETDSLYSAMDDIRLHRGGNLNLPLPTSIGQMWFVDKFDYAILHDSLEYLKTLQLNRNAK